MKLKARFIVDCNCNKAVALWRMSLLKYMRKKGRFTGRYRRKKSLSQGMPQFSEAWHRVWFNGQCCLFSNFATLHQCKIWSHESVSSHSLYWCWETEVLSWVGGSREKGTTGLSWGPRIIQAVLGFRRSLVQPAAQKRLIRETKMFSALSIFVLKTSKVGNCTTCPDSLFLPSCPPREVHSNIHLELVFAYKFHLVTKMKNQRRGNPESIFLKYFRIWVFLRLNSWTDRTCDRPNWSEIVTSSCACA